MDEHEKKHDYKDTIRQASGMEETDHAETQARLRKLEADRDLNYEILAVNSSMGMLGMEEEAADLMQLELASELLYDLNHDDPNPDDRLE